MEPICTSRFYGNKVQKQSPSRSKICWVKTYRVMPSHILGPTQYWQEFHKQADALAVAAERSTKTDALCTFVYQRPSDGNRKFVVAHPEVYWWYYKIKPQEERCSYEVSMQNLRLRFICTYKKSVYMKKTCFKQLFSRSDNKKTSPSINYFYFTITTLIFIIHSYLKIALSNVN